MSEAGQQTADGFGLYRRLLNYAFPYWKIFIVVILAMIVFAATDTGFAALMKPMLDGSFVNHDPNTIRLVPVALVGLFLFRVVTGFISRYGMSWIGRNVIHALRTDMYRQLLRLPGACFDQNAAGSLLSKLTFDVEQVAEASTSSLTILIRDAFTILFLLAYMLWVNVWLTLLFMIIGPLIIVVIRYAGKHFRRTSRHIQDSMGELTQFIEQTISGQQVIKSFTAATAQENNFSQVNRKNKSLHLKMALINSISAPVVQLIAACILAFVIYISTRDSSLVQLSVGEFVSFITAILLLMQPIKRLTNINVSLQRGIAAAHSIFNLIDTPAERDTGKNSLVRAKGDIAFDNVVFSYNNASGDVLGDVSLSVKTGEKVAFVGRSGSGKSTLVKLIMRLYEPLQGTISLDGKDIRDYSLTDLRRQIAFVSQDVMLFNDTIANNIAFGSEHDADHDAIIAAAESAHAMTFIKDLPQGLDTYIGDRGILLSGGQRQRIAIARAILKNAPILIFDEATSSLDSESEREVQGAIDALTENRTSLIIAHRLSTVEYADRIYVLEQGKIAETGSHEELITNDGLYSQLYRMQFSWPKMA